jgi:hypothetical protein
MKCPKCEYVRLSTDKAPDYECPSCGIIYAKYQQILTQREEATHSPTSGAPAALNATALRARRVPIALIILILVLCAVGGKFGADFYAKWSIEKSKAQSIKASKSVIEKILKDPASVQWRNEKLASNGQTLCGEVNAKNSMGGYVGFKHFIATPNSFLIEGGKYATWLLADNRTPVPDYMVKATKIIDGGDSTFDALGNVFKWFWDANCG